MTEQRSFRKLLEHVTQVSSKPDRCIVAEDRGLNDRGGAEVISALAEATMHLEGLLYHYETEITCSI